MDKRSSYFQWIQLFVLALAHFQADMFGAVLPPILPVLRSDFAITLAIGAGILVCHSFTHNGIQVLVGHIRAHKSRPLFLQAGLLLSGVICFVAVIPAGSSAVMMMFFLTLVGGLGIGMIHPEGLRGVHVLDKIAPSMSTAVYMTGGFLGSAFGGWCSAYLVARFGLKGLYFLLAGPVIAVLLIIMFRIRLAVDGGEGEERGGFNFRYKPSFLWLVIMALPAAVSTMIIVWLLPSLLNELGFELTFGGFCMLLFSLSAAAGSFFWGYLAHKKEPLTCATTALFLSVPLAIIYLLLIRYRAAAVLLFGSGFFAIGSYVLMVTLARIAAGLKIGQRMGIMVGGTWAAAGLVVLLGLKLFNLRVIFGFVPLGYLVSAIVGLYIFKTSRQAALFREQQGR